MKIRNATTPAAERACEDGFVRTVLTIEGPRRGSVLLADEAGVVLAMLNVTLSRTDEGETLIVDVIDGEGEASPRTPRYPDKSALSFQLGGPGPCVEKLDVTALVSVDFRRPARQTAPKKALSPKKRR